MGNLLYRAFLLDRMVGSKIRLRLPQSIAGSGLLWGLERVAHN